MRLDILFGPGVVRLNPCPRARHQQNVLRVLFFQVVLIFLLLGVGVKHPSDAKLVVECPIRPKELLAQRICDLAPLGELFLIPQMSLR